MKLIVPPCIKAGDKVATVSLSWGGAGELTHKYEVGKQQLTDAFDVEVVEMPHTLDTAADVYANPKARAEDLMQAFADPDIKGIFSCIGGNDSVRMLPYIDFDVIRNNPKPFLGYSDSTITHFICLKAGIRSYYGPSVMAGFAENGGLFPYMENSVRKALFTNEVIGEVKQNTDGWVVKQYPWEDESLLHKKRILNPAMERKLLQGEGKVQGHLIGGCMEVLEMLKGTVLWPELDVWKGAVLFFETSEDAHDAEEVIGWVRNLATQGILDVVNGIIIGRPGGDAVGEEYYQAQDDAFMKVVKTECGLDIPIMSRMDFGHTDPQFVVPYGAMAEIDCENKKFTILESGCVS